MYHFEKMKSRALVILLLFIPFILSIPWRVSEKILIENYRVLDGDTLKVGLISFRLAYIDAPELAQKYGKEVKVSLQNILGSCSQKLWAKILSKDIYHREVAEIFCAKTSINFQLVTKGMVFLYPYSQFESLRQKRIYQKEHKKALQKKAGPISLIKTYPWKFRRLAKKPK